MVECGVKWQQNLLNKRNNEELVFCFHLANLGQNVPMQEKVKSEAQLAAKLRNDENLTKKQVNNAVLPCNHLWLCQECGKKLSEDPAPDRKRCLICRTVIESLLHIIPTSLTTTRWRGDRKTSVEVENVSSGEGDDATAPNSPTSTIEPTMAPNATLGEPTTEAQDAASISSEVSESSRRREKKTVLWTPSSEHQQAAHSTHTRLSGSLKCCRPPLVRSASHLRGGGGR